MKLAKPFPPELGAVLFRYLAIAARNQTAFAIVLDALGNDPQTFGRHAKTLTQLGATAQGSALLSDILASRPGLFSEAAVALVAQAESADQLAPVMDALADDCQCQHMGLTAVRGSMTWPLQMGAVLLVLAILLSVLVVPAFKEVFASFGAELPLPTRVLLAASDFFSYTWWLVALVVAVVVVTVRRRRLPKGFVDFFWQVCSYVPLVRAYFERQFGARFAQWVAAVGSGPTPPALWAAVLLHLQSSSSAPLVRKAVATLMARLQSGDSLAVACGHTSVVPPSLIQAFRLSEAGQDGTGVLELCQQLTNDQARRAGERLGRHLFFASYLVVGVFTALFVIAIYLPIFKLGAVV